jgi:hypothetical protein
MTLPLPSSQALTDERVAYCADEILATDPGLEPLIANGVRCHGGLDSAGAYHSPRTLHRAPAIRAWQGRLVAEGADLLTMSRDLLPPQYPNVAQAKLLLRAGVRDPIIRALTMIAIVEGFGAVIRDVRVPDLHALVREPIDGTALSHLERGLFEAHARDEAGYRNEGGHKQMWEAARDLALDNPRIPPDVLMRVMGSGGRPSERRRSFPQLDETLEAMLATMVNVLVIEVFAAGTFDWGDRLLSDPEVSAEPERAGGMVRCIRSDETPHVEYLRTALSEIRARTLVTANGGTIPGRSVIDALLHRTLGVLTTRRPKEQRADTRASVAEAMKRAGSPQRLLEEFDALETPFVAPMRTGFEPLSGAEGHAA